MDIAAAAAAAAAVAGNAIVVVQLSNISDAPVGEVHCTATFELWNCCIWHITDRIAWWYDNYYDDDNTKLPTNASITPSIII